MYKKTIAFILLGSQMLTACMPATEQIPHAIQPVNMSHGVSTLEGTYNTGAQQKHLSIQLDQIFNLPSNKTILLHHNADAIEATINNKFTKLVARNVPVYVACDFKQKEIKPRHIHIEGPDANHPKGYVWISQGGLMGGGKRNQKEEALTDDEDKVTQKPYSLDFYGQEWNKDTIARDLWKDSTSTISEDMVKKVNDVSQYLAENGYQIQGAKADGNCFFHAFLESYETLERKIPLIDNEKNKIAYLRAQASKQYENSPMSNKYPNRANEIAEDGRWVSINEVGLLAKVLDIPIRVITVNEGHENGKIVTGIDDTLIFPTYGRDDQQWETIPRGKRPKDKEHVCIVDVGRHFLWATAGLSNSRIEAVTSGKEEADDQLDLERSNKKRATSIAVNHGEQVNVGNLSVLPRELLKEVFAYLSAQEGFRLHQLNKHYYQLMTGYNQPGLKGIKNQPQGSSLHTEVWGLRKMAFEKRGKGKSNFKHETMSSFFFYRLLGEAVDLPISFWSQLKYTNIHKLSFINIGLKGLKGKILKKLEEALPANNLKALEVWQHSMVDTIDTKDTKKNWLDDLGHVLRKGNLDSLRLDIFNSSKRDISNEVEEFKKGMALSKVLQGNRIKKLKLSFPSINFSDLQEFTEALPDSNIEELDLRLSHICKGGLELLTKALGGYAPLRKLRLNCIFTKDDQELSEFFPGSNIEELALNYVFGKSSLIKEQRSLNNVLAQQPIKHIDEKIRYNRIEKLKQFSKNIRYNQKLRKLDLSNNEIDDEFLKQLSVVLLVHNKLKELNLSFNNIEAACAEEISELLTGSNIEVLNLSNNQIHSEGFKQLLNGVSMSYLHKLDLSRNEITADGIKAICQGKSLADVDLQILNLSNNVLNSAGAEYLINSLKNGKVDSLILNEIKVHKGLNLVSIIKALKGKRIYSLSLVGNAINKSITKELYSALKETNIRKLDLSNNLIDDQHLKEISNALPGSQIIELLLFDNKISLEGLRSFCENLKNTQIRSINFAHNTHIYNNKLYLQNKDSIQAGFKSIGASLQQSQVTKVGIWLRRDTIHLDIQTLLKTQCPNITWQFYDRTVES